MTTMGGGMKKTDNHYRLDTNSIRRMILRSPRTFSAVTIGVVLLLAASFTRGQGGDSSRGASYSSDHGIVMTAEENYSFRNNVNGSKWTQPEQRSREKSQQSPDRSIPKDSSQSVSNEDLEEWLQNIKGDDDRLFRWDATKYTSRKRREGGCSQFDAATKILMDPTRSTASKSLAAEFLTFCITDSPEQRAKLTQDQHDVIHRVIVDLVASPNAFLSTLACHLIYIASFSNAVNHQAFLNNNAVQTLANVVLDKKSLTSQSMWAAAALQNLAASYCATENDGRCYWRWNRKQSQVVVMKKVLPMISDGTMARKQMMEIPGLVETLIKMACTGPVQGAASDDNIFPGQNAIVGRDDNNPHLLAWAATGALKNLALEPSSKLTLEPALQCMCYLKTSPDWLEKLKSRDLIGFMRRDDPCWFDGKEQQNLCVDQYFLDEEGYDCGEYEGATTEECTEKDVDTRRTANQACCACGGGTTYTDEDEN